ncbi:MAG: hypothetical protein NUV97_02930 [archaeon]|nr:hypothetical protein [archaeon]MCR4343834.1 hypothetical protein [Candidatus Scalindua sp.]
MIKQFYQGDVPILKGIKAPEGLEFKPLSEKGLIVMEGEMSGHHHRVQVKDRANLKDISFAQDENGYYLKVGSEAILTHPEHDTITLPQGIYFFGSQWEYNEIEDRKVID